MMISPALEAKMAPYAHFTEAQKEAVILAATTRINLSLRSTAGSGKSTVIKAMAQVITRERIIALAFNNTIEKELRAKLPEHVETRTIHGFCKDALTNVYGPLTLQEFKRNNLVTTYLKDLGIYATKDQRNHCVQLAHLALLTMTPATAEALSSLAQKFAYTLPNGLDLVDFVRTITTKSRELFLTRKEYDFTDLLYLVVSLNVLPGTVDTILADESQDFSALTRKVIEHFLGYREGGTKAGRLIAVGDPEQAVYGFTGADPDSMDRMEQLFDSQVLALDVTFRCPKLHVQYARLFSNFIRAADHAIEGEVECVMEHDLPERLTGGELVMSRNRAPLVSFALLLLSHGKSANLIGGDLQKEIASHLKSALTVPFAPSDVGARLQERARDLLKNYRERGMKPAAIQKAVARDADLLGCCAALATRAALDAEGGVGSLKEIEALLTKITSGKEGVQLCTIHAAKGLEADVTVILRPEDLKTEGEEGEAEKPVNFVALTRAKKKMYFAPRNSDWQMPTLPSPAPTSALSA